MATITPSVFKPLLAHVNVRLQQGVPIVDADWNLLDDIRKFEVRAFLKWYVGDGVPEGNDGFRVTSGLSNDFTVRAGTQGPPGVLPEVDTALRQVGRFLVDGLDVMLKTDVNYGAQPLHVSQPGSAALAAALGVPQIAALPAPANERIFVEIDVWERLVTPDDDPGNLVYPGLGVETCARTRREWVVRAWRESAPLTHIADHSYAVLAIITRFAGQAVINDANIVDRRQRRLLTPPSYLVTDMLGVDPFEYRAGNGRPAISLRDAINALLAGQLPTSADLAVSPGAGTDLFRRAVALDAGNGLNVVWHSPRNGGVNQLFTSRLDLARPDLGFSAAVQLTATGPRAEPSVVILPGGDFVLAYQTDTIGSTNADMVMKRAPLAGLAAAAERPLASTSGVADQWPFAVVCNDLVCFFMQNGSTGAWFYRRYNHTTDTFVDSAPVLLGAALPAGATGFLHAASAGGKVWAAYTVSSGATVQLLRFSPDTGIVDAIATTPGKDPFVLANSATDAQVVHDDTSITVISSIPAGTGWGTVETPVPDSAAEGQPGVVRGPDGTTHLITTRATGGSAGNDVYLRRRLPGTTGTSSWSSAQVVITSPSNDQFPHPVFVAGQGIWVLWLSDRTGNQDVYAKRIITAI